MAARYDGFGDGTRGTTVALIFDNLIVSRLETKKLYGVNWQSQPRRRRKSGDDVVKPSPAITKARSNISPYSVYLRCMLTNGDRAL